jgi:microcin C transport system permease protein
MNNNGWMVWPPIRYSYQTVNNELPSPAPDRQPSCSARKMPASAYDSRAWKTVNCTCLAT